MVLVYLLMTVNFQSWLDPFIILTALPGAMAGILWMLFLTGTTLSVPSLMGAIMCIGVATANSILMVTFANDERATWHSAREAMLSAGYARMRPVLMTATAMILGMLPMALGMGEGGEQNAPLGRAVIGGLMFATVTTLFVVPIIYSYLRKRPPMDHRARLVERERFNALYRFHARPQAPTCPIRSKSIFAGADRKTAGGNRGAARRGSFRENSTRRVAAIGHYHLGHRAGCARAACDHLFWRIHSHAEPPRGDRGRSA